MVIQIVLGPAILTANNAFILNTIDLFKNGIKLRQGYSKKHHKGEIIRIPYLIIDCNLKLTNKKGNDLKRYIKSLLNVNEIYFVIQTKK